MAANTRLNIELTARNLASPVMQQMLRDLQRDMGRIERLNVRNVQQARASAAAQVQAARVVSAAQVQASRVAANAAIQAQRRITQASSAGARVQVINARATAAAQAASARSALAAQQAAARRQAQILQGQQRAAQMATLQANRIAQMQLAQQQRIQLLQQRRGGGPPSAGGPAGDRSTIVSGAMSQLTTALKWVVLYQAVRDVTGAIAQIPATMIQANIETENALVTFKAFQGSAEAAASTLRMVREQSMATGQNFGDMATLARELMPQFGKNQKQLEHYLGTAQILGAMVPEQGLVGGGFSLAEAESGDYRSMTERFRMPRSVKNDLLKEGFKGAALVDEWLKRLGVDFGLVAEQQGTFSGQWARLSANAREFLRVVGFEAFKELRGGLSEINAMFSDNQEGVQKLADTWGGALRDAIRSVIDTIKTDGPTMLNDAKETFNTLVGIVRLLNEARGTATSVGGSPRHLFFNDDGSPRGLAAGAAAAVKYFQQEPAYARGSVGEGTASQYIGERGSTYGQGPGLVEAYEKDPLHHGKTGAHLDYGTPTAGLGKIPYGQTSGAFSRFANQGASFARGPIDDLGKMRTALQAASLEVSRLDDQLTELGQSKSRFGGLVADLDAAIKEMEARGELVPEWMRDVSKKANHREGTLGIQIGVAAGRALQQEAVADKMGSALKGAMKDLETQSMSVRATSVIVQSAGGIGGLSQGSGRIPKGPGQYAFPLTPQDSSFHTGTNFVPDDGLYNLQRGEVVLDRHEVASAAGATYYVDNRTIAPVIHGEQRPTEAAASFVRKVGPAKYDASRSGHGALGNL